MLFLELHNEMITAEGGDPNVILNLLAEFGYVTFALNGTSVERLHIAQTLNANSSSANYFKKCREPRRRALATLGLYSFADVKI